MILMRITTRSNDPYYISPEDRETILETLQYWEGKSMEDLSQTVLPAHTRALEKDDIICVGLENGVSGETLCDHEKILTVGIKGYMDECQKNIDNLFPQTMEEQAKVDFWKACIIQCQGLITYAHRMADEAERLASESTDEKRKTGTSYHCRKLQSRSGKPTTEFPPSASVNMVRTCVFSY